VIDHAARNYRRLYCTQRDESISMPHTDGAARCCPIPLTSLSDASRTKPLSRFEVVERTSPRPSPIVRFLRAHKFRRLTVLPQFFLPHGAVRAVRRQLGRSAGPSFSCIPANNRPQTQRAARQGCSVCYACWPKSTVSYLSLKPLIFNTNVRVEAESIYLPRRLKA
jgi:hypothetical protein